MPTVDNQTEVVLLQHAREQHHPFNTARIVHQALQRCRLVVDQVSGFAGRRLPLGSRAALLYPAEEARPLSEFTGDDHIEQLVVLDGTWHQAKTLLRDVSALQELPCFRLQPFTARPARIRRESDPNGLSTIEATVAALKLLEPKTSGLDELLKVFDVLVEKQLAASNHSKWRNRKPRTREGIPRALAGQAGKIVVVYGEATPYSKKPCPVSWYADRLDGSGHFSRLISQNSPLDEAVLTHFGLTRDSFDYAVEPNEFLSDWHSFIRPSDTLVAFHEGTLRLLHNLGAAVPSQIALKPVFGKLNPGKAAPEDLFSNWCPKASLPSSTLRGESRLQQAVALTHVLRDRLLADD